MLAFQLIFHGSLRDHQNDSRPKVDHDCSRKEHSSRQLLTSSLPIHEKDFSIFQKTKKWLDIYFSGKEPNFVPKLKQNGSDFRQEVWKILRDIPYGKTITYGDIAKIIAKKRGVKRISAQAVGGAVGHNSISIIVPCHRVVGANKNLIGYTAGLNVKKYLLGLERVGILEYKSY